MFSTVLSYLIDLISVRSQMLALDFLSLYSHSFSLLGVHSPGPRHHWLNYLLKANNKLSSRAYGGLGPDDKRVFEKTVKR